MLAIQLGDVDDGNVEGTTTQVIHRDLAVAFLLVQTKGQRRSGWLIDDALHFQTSDATGILGGLALAVVEVGRHGNHRFCHWLAQVIFGGFLHLHQHLCRHFRCGDFLVAHLHPSVAILGLDDGVRHHVDVFLHHLFVKTTANQTLHPEQGVLGVGDGLTLGGRAHQHFAVFHVSDNRRSGTRTFGVFNHLGLAVFHHRHAGVGGAQVNTNDLCHFLHPLLSSFYDAAQRGADCVDFKRNFLGREKG